MASPTKMDIGILLPFDFQADERGSTWLFDADEGNHHIAWLSLAGDYRLEVEVNSANYPGFTVKLMYKSDKELTDHIFDELSGWFIKKVNLNDPRWEGVEHFVPYAGEEE